MRKFVDDGRTIYDMTNVGSPEQMKRASVRNDRNKTSEGTKVTFKEKTAVIRAAFQVYAPILFGVIACFTVVAVALYFWLK